MDDTHENAPEVHCDASQVAYCESPCRQTGLPSRIVQTADLDATSHESPRPSALSPKASVEPYGKASSSGGGTEPS